MMPATTKEAVTVRLEAGKRAELDALARTVSRDRSFLINEAIDAYLAVHRWQVVEIEQGLRQADAGEFATEAELEAAYAAFR